MVGLGLKLRYIAAVLTVGALLTAAVAVVTRYSAAAEHEKLRAVDEQLDAIPAPDPRLAAAQERLHEVVEDVYDGQTVNIAIAGGLLTLMAGIVVLLIMVRIDRALVTLMDNAQSIGRGRYAEPIAVSGVAETAALESSLEQMRQALTTTTISRDFLDDVLNGIKDAVLVMTTDGRMRPPQPHRGESAVGSVRSMRLAMSTSRPQALQRAVQMLPWSSRTRLLPARWCILSMFCVTTSKDGKLSSNLAIARCAALGSESRTPT